MPIAPQIDQGTITVKMKALSHIVQQDIAVDIDILVGFSI